MLDKSSLKLLYLAFFLMAGLAFVPSLADPGDEGTVRNSWSTDHPKLNVKGMPSPADYREITDVPYLQPADSVHVGDIVLPTVDVQKPYPAVVLIHGGGWSGGSRTNLKLMARRMAQHGYAVFNIDYRLVGEGGEFPNDVIDVQDALAFLELNAEKWAIDPQRVACIGSSAGAHLAMMLGYTKYGEFGKGHYDGYIARPKAVISKYGTTDFEKQIKLKKNTNTELDYLSQAGQDAIRLASPISYADSAVPTLFVHGTADMVVPYEQSVEMHDALLKRGISSYLIPIEGAGHGQFDQDDMRMDLVNTLKFLNDNLARAPQSK